MLRLYILQRVTKDPDYDTRTYIVTDKGDDALEHWIA